MLHSFPQLWRKSDGVVFNMRDSVLNPPSYDPRNIVDLLDKYSDAHIIDSGWREVDTEEWVA